MSSPNIPATELGTSHSLGFHEYNAPCVMFFAIVGLVLQVPVIYTHCGLFSRPNIPVVLMSLSYIYLMLSTTIAASYWHGDDSTTWWDGSYWCDIDVRLFIAVSLLVLSAQCAINWNIIELLGDRPRLIIGSRALKRGIIEFIGCLLLPVLNLAVSTFYMYRRYQLIQDIGCSAVTDSSIAVILTFFMWIPILGLGALVTMLWIGYRFLKRKRELSMETMTFMPNMNASQLIRIVLFSCAVTFIFVPLIICVAVINFVNIGQTGVNEVAWAHGKPEKWNEIVAVTFNELASVITTQERASMVVNLITRYINIAIAWLLFICYGTGLLASEAYKAAFYKIFNVKKGRNDSFSSEKLSNECLSSTESKFSFGLNGREWDPDFYGAKALKEWESGHKSICGEPSTGYSSKFSYSPPVSATSEQRLIELELPKKGTPKESRRPILPMRDLIGGKPLFAFMKLKNEPSDD